MPYKQSISKPAQNTRVLTKKIHDDGLSAKERIFVHSLRALFDPKGKGRASSRESKDFVPGAARGGKPQSVKKVEPRDGGKPDNYPRTMKPTASQRRVLESPKSLPPSQWVARRKAGFARKDSSTPVMKKDAPKGVVDKAKAKLTKTAEKHVSPSAKKRAERRVNKQRAWKLDQENIKRKRYGKKPIEVKLPLSPPVKESKTKQNAKKSKPIPTMCDVLPKNVKDLEVVQAWGGVEALLLLSKYKKTSPYLSQSITANGGEYLGPDTSCGMSYVYVNVTRDMNKASAGLSQSCEKLHLIKTEAMHSFKKLETSSKKTKTSILRNNAMTRRLEKRRSLRGQNAKGKSVQFSQVVDVVQLGPVKGTRAHFEETEPTYSVYVQKCAKLTKFQTAQNMSMGDRGELNELLSDAVSARRKLDNAEVGYRRFNSLPVGEEHFWYYRIMR